MITECDALSSGSGEGGLLSAPLKCSKDLILRGDGVSTIKRVDEEEADELQCDVQKRESEDRNRLNHVRTVFYQLNERFE